MKALVGFSLPDGSAAAGAPFNAADAKAAERLHAIATKAEKCADARMLQAARASLMDAAKLNGLVVEKGGHQHKHIGLSVTYVTPADPEAP